MNLTTAFLFLFITIIIPGFLFQRIYFFGDFSKQFTTRENVSRLLLTSLIPGLLISGIYLPCYNYFSWNDVRIEEILTLFERLSDSNVHDDPKSLKVFSNYSNFIIYCIFECIAAIGLGFIVSRIIVRGIRLDHRWKTLRYSNQWYYVFSGEVFEFNKFKRATRALSKKSRKGKDVELAKADILIKGAEGNELYTGYVADYDLNPTDISKLDNIYLLDAVRYKTMELNEGVANIKQPAITERKLIPGELFVLNLTSVININVSYLLRPVPAKKPGQIPNWASFVIQLLAFCVFLPGALFIFYNPAWMDLFGLSRFAWYVKLPLFILYMNFIDVLIPRYDKELKVHYYKRRDLVMVLVIFVLLVTLCSIFVTTEMPSLQ